MSWGNSGYGNSYGLCISRIKDFAQAKRKFETTAPIRRRVPEVRPLGNRKDWEQANIAMPNADTVELSFAGSVLISWRSDDSFTVFHPRYCTAYVPKHITEFLPTGFFERYDGRLFLVMGEGKRYLLEEGGSFNIQLTEHKYFMLDKPVAYAVRVKRGVAQKLMGSYTPFLDWLTVVLACDVDCPVPDIKHSCAWLNKVSGVKDPEYYHAVARQHSGGKDYATRNKAWQEERLLHFVPFSMRNVELGFHRGGCETLHAWITGTDAEQWVKARGVITLHVGAYIGYHSGDNAKMRLSVAKAIDYLTCIISFLNRDVVFTKVKLEDGERPSVRNTEYFKEIVFVL
jgi:hypothetical protein